MFEHVITVLLDLSIILYLEEKVFGELSWRHKLTWNFPGSMCFLGYDRNIISQWATGPSEGRKRSVPVTVCPF